MEGWQSNMRQQPAGMEPENVRDKEYLLRYSLTLCKTDGVDCDRLVDRMKTWLWLHLRFTHAIHDLEWVDIFLTLKYCAAYFMYFDRGTFGGSDHETGTTAVIDQTLQGLGSRTGGWSVNECSLVTGEVPFHRLGTADVPLTKAWLVMC